MNVTAKETTNTLTGFKVLAFPAYLYGVSASAGTGSESTGDLLDDLANSAMKSVFGSDIKKKLVKKLSSYIKQNQNANQGQDPTNPTWQFTGAICVNLNTFSSTARIGDGVSGDTATVVGSGGVNVSATVTESPEPGASATVDSTSQEETKDQSGNVTDPTTTTGGALAVTFGNFPSNATAYIAGNAVVDSGGPLVVTSDPNGIFNPIDYFLSNFFYALGNAYIQPTYTSDSGTESMYSGYTVEVDLKYANGGDGGATYEYIGPDNALVNLGTTNYANPNQWTPYDVVGNVGLTFFQTLSSYLTSDFGIANNVPTSITQAVAIGQKTLSVAASIELILLDNNSTATIDTGARINQNTAFREAAANYTANTPGLVTVQPNQTVLVEPGYTRGGYVGSEYQYIGTTDGQFNLGTTDFTNANDWSVLTQQDVLVDAVNEDDAFHVVGNYPSFGYGGIPKEGENWFSAAGLAAGGSSTPAAVGVAVLGVVTTANTTARIQDGVTLYAADLGVEATNKTIAAAIGISGVKSSNFGFNGVVLYNKAHDTTIASIGAGASVTVGSAHVIEPGVTNVSTNVTPPSTDSGDSTLVEASDDVELVTGAGSITLGQKLGFGASISVNDVSRDTEAYIGNVHTASSGPTIGMLQSAGPIAIDATNTGFVFAVSVAGAVARMLDSKSNAGDANPPAAPTVNATFALGVAVAVNTISDGDLAYINGATVASNSGLTLDAEYTPYFDAFTIGGSLNTTAGTPAGQTASALAGASPTTISKGLQSSRSSPRAAAPEALRPPRATSA